MAKNKRTTGQTTIYKILHRKQKIEQHKHNQKSEVNSGFRKGKQFLLHDWHLLCYSCYKGVISICNSKDRKHNSQKKKNKRSTNHYSEN